MPKHENQLDVLKTLNYCLEFMLSDIREDRIIVEVIPSIYPEHVVGSSRIQNSKISKNTL